jgi:hypothetical protein
MDHHNRPRPGMRLMRFIVLMAIEEVHHTILRGQFQLLNAFLFQFLGGSQINLVAEGFELLLELEMLLIQFPQALVMNGMPLD